MLSLQDFMQLLQSMIWLLAGVGVFIVGMNFMGDALEKSAGMGLKRLLERISNNRLSGVGIGAGLEIWKFQLSGRYCWDLGEVGKYSWTDANNNIMSATPKTKGFELSIAIIF